MKRLSMVEWIAVGVALFVGSYFLMGDMVSGLFRSPNDMMNDEQQGKVEQATTTQSELTGPAAQAGSVITVHYTGTLRDGTVFDSSKRRNQPFQFVLGRGDVIKGWDNGLMGARAGEKRTLTIPPAEAYGAVPGHPLQNETLIFEVEVLEVKNQ